MSVPNDLHIIVILCGVVVVSLSLNIYPQLGIKHMHEDLPPPAVKQKGVFNRVCCFALYVLASSCLTSFSSVSLIELPSQSKLTSHLS